MKLVIVLVIVNLKKALNLSAFLLLLKIKKLKYIPEFHTRNIKNVITYIFFETTGVAKDVLMTWVWHPMGREGLEPATR